MFNGVALIIAVALSIQRSPSAQWQKIKARFRRGQAPPGSDGDGPVDEVSGPAAVAGSQPGSGPH
jgi:hypothetical protein